MTQQSICIVTDVGRTLISQYLVGDATFTIDKYAIGKGSVGVAPSPTATVLDSTIQYDSKDFITPLVTTYIAPSTAEFTLTLPTAFESADPITELGLIISNGQDVWGPTTKLFAYATFEGITKQAGNELTFNIRIQP